MRALRRKMKIKLMSLYMSEDCFMKNTTLITKDVGDDECVINCE